MDEDEERKKNPIFSLEEANQTLARVGGQMYLLKNSFRTTYKFKQHMYFNRNRTVRGCPLGGGPSRAGLFVDLFRVLS